MSYARKAVGSVQSIAHGPAGTCSTLVIARLNLAINARIHHWEEPSAPWKPALITPPLRIIVKSHTEILILGGSGLASGGSPTMNKRSRRRRYSFFAYPWINPVDPRNTSSVPVTAGVLRDHPCSRSDHSLSDDMDGKNKCSARNLADRFPQDYSFLQSKGNQTGNVLPYNVRERKPEIIDIGVDKFSTHNNFIFREWEFHYARASITKVEIMLAITV